MNFRKIEFIDFESKNNLTQKTWLVILMMCAVYFVYNICILFGSVFIGIFYALNNLDANPTNLLDSNLIKLYSLFITSISIMLALLYVNFIEKRPLSSAGITKKGVLRQYGMGYLLGILMIGLPVVVLLLFNGNISTNSNINYGILALYFLGFLVQGASEEILIRGYFMTSLAKTTNTFWAIFISSFGFAILHLSNPNMGLLPFVNLFLFGVFAGMFFLRTKNIWAICALHSAWNFFQGNVFGINVSGQIFGNSILTVTSTAPKILSGGDFGLEGGLLVTIMLVVATLIIGFYGKNKLIVKSTQQN